MLRAERSGDRIPVGARFSAPIQTSHGAHPASCIMGSGSFPGVKRSGHGINHPPPSSAKVTESLELHLYSTSGPSWPVLWWNLPLPLPYIKSKHDATAYTELHLHSSASIHLHNEVYKYTNKWALVSWIYSKIPLTFWHWNLAFKF
jgi:hypothetical protein